MGSRADESTMSGIEVAGLVLGTLPLIISALEHYEGNHDRAWIFFKWKDELYKALREAKLGKAYKVYVYTIQEMQEHMRTLSNHLDIDRQNVCTVHTLHIQDQTS